MRFRKAVLTLAVLLLSSLAVAQGTYTQIDYPGAANTGVWGIDTAGDIVGSADAQGFLLSNGVFTAIEVSNSLPTVAYGINDEGQIVGASRPNNSNQFNGFIYDLQTQLFSTIQYSQSTYTFAYEINNAGTIVGFVQMPDSSSGVGFELNGSTFETIALPDATETALTAINNSGESMVLATNSSSLRSFLLQQGKLVKIEKPNNVEPYGINDLGAITGSRTISGGHSAGFVEQAGVRQSLTFPGSASTVPTAINNSGEVVGFFYDANYVLHGFTWTPPAAAGKK